MISFQSDYTEGAHPEVLDALVKTNLETVASYGYDSYTLSAAEKIKKACDAPDAQVYFLTGGTQTNRLVLDSCLAPFEGVLSADTGHIAVHEAGAIEASGHKVLTLKNKNGKLCAEDVERYVTAFFADPDCNHMVIPAAVYISQPTEYGTLYSLEELTALSEVCRRHSLTLYADGARLGYALASDACDVTLADMARLCDVFYIGGTKVGALCGEAVVFTHGNMPRRFETFVKQNGAMIAKSRLIGVQFDALFTDDLYIRAAAHGIRAAARLRAVFAENNIPFFIDSPTNQQFVILEKSRAARLSEKLRFGLWENISDSQAAYRFVTSWSTSDEAVDALDKLLKEEA